MTKYEVFISHDSYTEPLALTMTAFEAKRQAKEFKKNHPKFDVFVDKWEDGIPTNIFTS